MSHDTARPTAAEIELGTPVAFAHLCLLYTSPSPRDLN